MLIYSFDTKRNKELLENLGHEIFYFKKLKNDLEIFKSLILEKNPKRILGVVAFKRTQYESLAINQFNRSKKINIQGEDFFNLFIPNNNLRINQNPYDSFCNWSSYKIAEFVSQQSLNVKVSFLHCNQSDRKILGEIACLQ